MERSGAGRGGVEGLRSPGCAVRWLALEDGRHLGPGARDRGPRSGLTSRRDGRTSMCRNLDTLKRFMAAGTERAQPRRLGASALRCAVGSYPGLPQLPAPPARSLWTPRHAANQSEASAAHLDTPPHRPSSVRTPSAPPLSQ